MLYQSVLFDRGGEMAKKKKNYYVFLLKNEQDEYNQVGIVNTWDECQNVCNGKSGEKHKGFFTEEEVVSYLKKHTSLNKEKIDVVLRDRKLEGEVFEFYEQEKVVISDVAEHIGKNDNTIRQNVKNIEVNSDNTVSNTCIGIMKSCAQEHIVVEERVNEFCRQFKFNNFSEEQKIAVQTVNGQVLLFAIPGSGKTTVIIARTGYMINKLHINPSEIISITFTKAAAREMRERFLDYFPDSEVPDFRTIHSLCYSIILPMLRSQGFTTPQHLLGAHRANKTYGANEEKKPITPKEVFKKLWDKVVKNTSYSLNSFDLFMENAQNAITAIKNKEIKEEDYCNSYIRVKEEDVPCKTVFDSYQEILEQNDCMDFDDLLKLSYEGLKDYKTVVYKLREKFKYWNVDEAQDNSYLQYKLLNLICNTTCNLFMVGDDDQSIYSFRGASPGLLLRYSERPSTVSLFMSTNYRSDQCIVNTAKLFIEGNENREPKAMQAFSNMHGKIDVPQTFSNESQQYSYIVNAAKEAVKKGSSLAILFRRNISSLPLIVYMAQNGIRYETNKKLADIMKTRDVQNIWKFLCFICDLNNLEKFREIWGFKNIKLWSERIGKELQKKKELNCNVLNEYENILNSGSLFVKEEQRKIILTKKLSFVKNLISEIIELKPSEAIIRINEKLDWVDLYGIGARLRFYALLSAADLFNTIPEFVEALNRIIKTERKCADNNLKPEELDEDTEMVFSDANEEKPVVTLTTVHSAKGREFDRVIIIDALEDILPGKIFEDSLIKDYEEERRLFYVAVTRAAHELDLLTVEKYHGNIEIISSFVKEFELLSGKSNNVAIEYEENDLYSIAPVNYNFNGGYKKEKNLNYTGIDRFLIGNERDVFNKPVNLPSIVTKAVYERLGVDKIGDLEKQRLDQLRRLGKMYGDNANADYHYATEAYLLAYMPVNFYKVWKPLRDLARLGKIPKNCNVLELGAGPGTSTMGLLSFYGKLAAGNLDSTFKVNIQAVEKEKKFREIFIELTERLITELPSNLEVNVQFINRDALCDCEAYWQKYDLIMESNMFNLAEAISEEQVDSYVKILKQVTKPNSVLIMIEPADPETMAFFTSISDRIQKEVFELSKVKSLNKKAVDVSGIKLFKDTLENRIRFKDYAYHWFSYMTFFKSEEVQ